MKRTILIIETLSSGIGFQVIREAIFLQQDFIFVSLNRSRTERLIPVDLIGTFTIHYCDDYCVEFLENLIDNELKIEISGVTCMLDDLLSVASEFARKRNLLFTNSRAINLCSNKSNTREFCLKNKILCPDFAIHHLDLNSQPKWSKFPAIIKPVSSAGSMDVERVDTSDQLITTIERHVAEGKHKSILIEELLFGPLFSVEGYVSTDEVNILGLTDRTFGSQPYFVEKGMNFPAIRGSDIEKKINFFTADLIRKLQFDFGFFHAEIMVCEDNIYLIEINPRVGGRLITLMIGAAYGVNFYEEYFKLALGDNPSFEKVVQGCSTNIIFPDRKGILTLFNHSSTSKYKHLQQKLLNKEISVGSIVSPPKDFRGHLLITMCTAESTEYAHAINRSVASSLIINIESND